MWVGISLVVVLIVMTAVLATVPVGQRMTYQTDGLVTGPTLRGCGESLFDLAAWTFPAGKVVHFSWTTDPASDVFVNISTVLPSSFGPTFYSGYGSLGTDSFFAKGGTYNVNVTNCNNQQTTATVSAYYYFNAPLL